MKLRVLIATMLVMVLTLSACGKVNEDSTQAVDDKEAVTEIKEQEEFDKEAEGSIEESLTDGQNTEPLEEEEAQEDDKNYKWDINDKDRHLSEEHLLEWDEQFVNSDAFMEAYADSYFYVDGVMIHIPTTPRQVIKLFELDESATDIICCRESENTYTLSVEDCGNGGCYVIHFSLNEDIAGPALEKNTDLKYDDLADIPLKNLFFDRLDVLLRYDIAFPFYTSGYTRFSNGIDLQPFPMEENTDPDYVIMTDGLKVYSQPTDSDMFSSLITDIPVGELLEFKRYNEDHYLDDDLWIGVLYNNEEVWIPTTETIIVKYKKSE